MIGVAAGDARLSAVREALDEAMGECADVLRSVNDVKRIAAQIMRLADATAVRAVRIRSMLEAIESSDDADEMYRIVKAALDEAEDMRDGLSGNTVAKDDVIDTGIMAYADEVCGDLRFCTMRLSDYEGV